ncbi:MAG: N-acetyl-gamma-glutamyl-phosphate reductase [Planctomycetes bacterium]|nr:N-acetyl-gamma-glutamyl-phosphate reductase [Planctomycetota bacterium]MBI3845004.1 N-acetyl-gamma-glutamyl-phosphate reductase [Planctomycetota bacterium]
MTTPKKKIAIVGGSGYGAAELLRILLFHPGIEIAAVCSQKNAGKPVADVHRNLRRLCDLKFTGDAPEEVAEGVDLMFLAAPNLASLELVPRLLETKARIVDLSGDFRLRDAAAFKRYYKHEHGAMEAQKQFIYGLPELFCDSIRSARAVASPGCFATAVTLALAPIAAEGAAEAAVVDAVTGSSGSGATPAENTHHPRRANAFYAYKTDGHQHLPEIVQALGDVGGPFRVHLQTHSAPLVRGIFVTALVPVAIDPRPLFARFYERAYFVRLPIDGGSASPDVANVANTNFADVGFAAGDGVTRIFVAIDNLVKGGAGQAVQSMNLMLGFDEATALKMPGGDP